MFHYKTNGVTLLEIIIAAMIVAIALIPVLSSIQYGNKATVKVNNYSKAERLAQELIEECKHIPVRVYYKDYNALVADKWEVVNEQYFPKTKEVLNDFGKTLKSFSWKAELKVVKPSEIIREIWIRVAMAWKEGDSNVVTRELRLANAIYNPEAD
ncbi:hypothetical protein HYY75_05940 [bacterium]|nr:hypothetical protein [bacterium]